MGLDFNLNKLFGKGDEDAMQLSKRTIVKSVLFVIAFWTIVGALMCLLYRLTSQIDLAEIITVFLSTAK